MKDIELYRGEDIREGSFNVIHVTFSLRKYSRRSCIDSPAALVPTAFSSDFSPSPLRFYPPFSFNSVETRK